MFKRSWIDRGQGQAEGGKALRLSEHEMAFLEEVKAANPIIGFACDTAANGANIVNASIAISVPLVAST